MDLPALKKKILLISIAAPLVLGIILFLPAGTIYYWQAWMYLITVLLPAALVVLYFLKNDPEFLERRFQTREKEARQGLIVRMALVVFIIAYIIPGLDYRSGWSHVPAALSVAADIVVFFGYLFVFLVFKENSYAGRTIRVEKGQKVVTSGPYAIMRHPMYLGVLVMYIATPIALASYVALPFFLLVIPILVFRILNEEEVLRRELPGYSDYCMKTRYRLIPFIW